MASQLGEQASGRPFGLMVAAAMTEPKNAKDTCEVEAPSQIDAIHAGTQRALARSVAHGTRPGPGSVSRRTEALAV
jgi:hypothetical protein